MLQVKLTILTCISLIAHNEKGDVLRRIKRAIPREERNSKCRTKFVLPILFSSDIWKFVGLESIYSISTENSSFEILFTLI